MTGQQPKQLTPTSGLVAVPSHRVSENDNAAIDLVAKAWNRAAETGRAAVELIQQVDKVKSAYKEAVERDAERAVARLHRVNPGASARLADRFR